MMGTKGRDKAVWIFLILTATGLLTPGTKYVLIPIIIVAAGILNFYLRERPRAIRYSQVALLPINRYWARLLVGKRLHGQWQKAYEVHISFTKEPLKLQRNRIVGDLIKISQTRPGLYLFETHISLPIPIRCLLDDLAKDKLAFFREGAFVPRPPLVYTKTRFRKKLHFGAAIIKAKGGLNAQEDHYNYSLSAGCGTSDRINNQRRKSKV